MDHRVDIYSLACLLYETLTACKPFTGEGLPAQMYAHVNLPSPAPSAQCPGIPPGLDELVARGMAKDPQQRYRSAGDLAVARDALDPAPSTPAASATNDTIAPNARPPTDNTASAAQRAQAQARQEQETLIPTARPVQPQRTPSTQPDRWARAGDWVGPLLSLGVGFILLVGVYANALVTGFSVLLAVAAVGSDMRPGTAIP